MQNKITKKLIPMGMVLIMAALLVSVLTMNVFAGTGKNGVIKAPYDVISFQGDSSYCMKKGNQVKLIKALCKGAKFEGFVSENPEVATVNGAGVITAVGPGETTITAKAKLKGDNQIHTSTCRVIVTGLIAEYIKIESADSTVKGTFYGKNGSKYVDRKIIEADIGDIVEIDASNQVVVKDAVIVPKGATLNVKNGATLNVKNGGTINVKDNGQFYVQNGGTPNGSTLNIENGGSVHIQNGGELYVGTDSIANVKDGGSVYISSGGRFLILTDSTANIENGGSVYVQNDGYVAVHDQFIVQFGGTLIVYDAGTLDVYDAGNGTLNVSENGVLVKQQSGKYTDKKWQGT